MSVEFAAMAFSVEAVVSLAMSWLLVSRLERVGERFGLSEALLGLLAALAADTPEITASVTALSRNQKTVGAGVVIGSNVFNLAALLGLGAVVAGRIGLHRKVVAAVYLAGRGRGAAALSTALNSNSLNVVAGLLAPAALIGLAKPSGQGLGIGGWYLGLTALTLALAYGDRGLRRWTGWLIIACYGAFVVFVLAFS